jgi:succinate-acetate transporter protein
MSRLLIGITFLILMLSAGAQENTEAESKNSLTFYLLIFGVVVFVLMITRMLKRKNKE